MVSENLNPFFFSVLFSSSIIVSVCKASAKVVIIGNNIFTGPFADARIIARNWGKNILGLLRASLIPRNPKAWLCIIDVSCGKLANSLSAPKSTVLIVNGRPFNDCMILI